MGFTFHKPSPWHAEMPVIAEQCSADADRLLISRLNMLFLDIVF